MALKPLHKAEGVSYVIVNGTLAVDDSNMTKCDLGRCGCGR